MTAEPVSAVATPLRAVLLSQRWCDLAFLHWFVPAERVLRHLPPGTRPDVVERGPHAGLTPVALVPFRMVGSGLGRGPAVPYLGTFWETNVRLYSVDARGRRGVVFASLDASRLAVVVAARVGLGLPYRWARMRGSERWRDGARELAWTTRTRWPGPRGLRSRVVVRVGAPLAPGDEDATLAEYLTARWGLHTTRLGRTWYLRNEHATWSLAHAEVLALDDELLGAAGFADLARRRPDHVAFAAGVRTSFGLPA
jgi:uncharacterized protein YqjF (DUF2071 family)